MTWTLVDLGSKRCGAIDAFVKHRQALFGGDADMSREKILAVDMNPDYGKEATDRGFQFRAANIADPSFEWPVSMYYSASHFLEHLPSIEASNVVLKKMMGSATHGIMLKMPCFEPEMLKTLDDAGLRFTWTTWKCHRSAYTTRHVEDIVENDPDWRVVKKSTNLYLNDATHKTVVPKGAPRDASEYLESMGPKPQIRFTPPLWREIDMLLVRTNAPMNIEAWDVTFERILAAVKAGGRMAFTRFGDGEWYAILSADEKWHGRFTTNKRVSCGIQGITKPMSEALKGVILGRPEYLFGMQPLAARVMGDAISEWLGRHKVIRNLWVNSDALHYASANGRLKELVSACAGRPIVLVGPKSISPVMGMIGAVYHVVTRDSDCWEDVDALTSATRAALEAAGEKAIAFVSAGPTARVIVDRLYREGRSLIDTGSVWDIYAGMKTRAYHPRVNTGQLA